MKKKPLRVVTLMFFVLLLALYVSVDAGLFNKKELPVDYSGTKWYVDSIKKAEREKAVFTESEIILDTSSLVEEEIPTPVTKVNNNEERLRILSSSKSVTMTPIGKSPFYKPIEFKIEPETDRKIKPFSKREIDLIHDAKMDSYKEDFAILSSSKSAVRIVLNKTNFGHPDYWKYQLWKMRYQSILNESDQQQDSLK
jgi:hypothetical protein